MEESLKINEGKSGRNNTEYSQKIISDLWKNGCVKYLLGIYNHTEDSTVKEVPPTLFEVEQENSTKLE